MAMRLRARLAILVVLAAAAAGRGQISHAQEKTQEIAVTLRAGVAVWGAASITSKQLGSLKAGEALIVTGYRPLEKFYAVRFRNKPGYVDARQVPETEELAALIARTPGETAGASPRAGGELDNVAAKRQVLTMLYGGRIAARIMERKTWVGMTKPMVIQSIGEPKSIKKVVFSNIIKEHWKYEDGTDLYFENDTLKAIGGLPPGIQPVEPTVIPPAGDRSGEASGVKERLLLRVHDPGSDASAAAASAARSA